MITWRQFNLLDTAIGLWERMQWKMCTGRTFPLRDTRKLVAAGLMQPCGQVCVCDGDGFAREPEQWRDGYEVTSAGRVARDEYLASIKSTRSAPANRTKEQRDE